MQSKPMTVLTGNTYTTFLDAIRSKHSVKTYKRALRLFCEFAQMDTNQLIERAVKDADFATELIRNYLRMLKDKVQAKQLQPSTVSLYFATVKLFYSMNDITLNWIKLSKMLPEPSTLEDKLYTKPEINKMLELADVREKVLLLLLASAGLRIGALTELLVSHVIPLHHKNKLIAGRLKVYANTNAEYITFITPETYRAIEQYLEYRRRNHEELKDTSPLIRDKINAGAPSNAKKQRFAKHLAVSSLQMLVWRLLIKSGIREQSDVKRYGTKLTHGFRKFFNTVCMEVEINPVHKEMFLGHTIGMEKSYYRPSEKALLQSYIKVIPALTFNDAEVLKVQNIKLAKEVNAYKSLQAEVQNTNQLVEKLKHKIEVLELTRSNDKDIAEPSHNVVK